MLTKDELQKRIARDEELYTQLTNDRRTVYQRLRRYRNQLYYLSKIQDEIEDETGGIKTYNGKPYKPSGDCE